MKKLQKVARVEEQRERERFVGCKYGVKPAWRNIKSRDAMNRAYQTLPFSARGMMIIRSRSGRYDWPILIPVGGLSCSFH